MISKVHYSSKRQDWATPWRLFEILNREFAFTLDAAASTSNRTSCLRHLFVEHVDGLTVPWTGSVWCNPPYGRRLGDWVEKGYRESSMCGTSVVVMLLPARTDTSWWHDYCLKGEIRFLRGRLAFDDDNRHRAPFPSAIVVFRNSSITRPK